MTTTDAVIKEALAAGFSAAAPLDPKKLVFLPEVRAMCSADMCSNYNKSWSCPPACGTLDEFAERAHSCEHGVLLQTTANIEEPFDYESIEDAEKRHKDSFYKLSDRLRPMLPGMFPMGSGGCRICGECTYPDSPCRFPERMSCSMEACGLLVSRVCEDCGLPYYHGPGTMTFTACILWSEPSFKSKQNKVVPCIFDGRAAVKKAFSSDDHLRNETETAAILKSAGLRVPELYSHEENTLIYERIGGSTLTTLLETESLPDDAVHSLASWLSRCWTALRDARGEPYILGDIHLANFIWDGADIAGIDFEECRPGMPEDDFCRLLAHMVTYNPSFSEYELKKAGLLSSELKKLFPFDSSRLEPALEASFRLIFERRKLPYDIKNVIMAKDILLG